MYDDGRKSFLSSIFYSILWIGGLVLLLFVVYKLGFSSLFGDVGGADNETVAEADTPAPIINEEELIEAELEAEEEAVAEDIPEETPGEVSEEEMVPAEDEDAARINEIIAKMTPEAKVAQLFFITPEQLTGVGTVSAFGDKSVSSYTENPVGGIIYNSPNFVDPDQTKEMLSKANECSREVTGLPLFIGIDEEGGRILRLAGNDAFGIEKTPSMAELSGEGVEDAVYHAADKIGAYLKEYGFNVNFAPDADVITEPENKVIGDRSFGTDPSVVSKLSVDYLKGLHNNGILSCFKHFPGHGGTKEDTHEGYASSDRSLDDLRSAEFLPFMDGIANNTDFIMTAHISLPNVPETEGKPSTLSSYLITDVLRNELGFSGIVITDALNMGAIADNFESGEAASSAFIAGCDMLLMPSDYKAAYKAILDKVNSGEITEERLNESLYRIIRAKLSL
ncbi:MAG: glycoside hydrolase family 3 protein [Lachnospiraceae bacterium]|nr:glycoside hydrolase family 3 protein [Lachnospiraceae bacterium]